MFEGRSAGTAVRTLLAGALALAVLVIGCGRTTVDATFSMTAGRDGAPTEKVLYVTLVTSKGGRTPVVAGAAGTGQVAGGHNFPVGTTAEGMVAYYRGLLANAGWKEGEDFTTRGESLTLLGVDSASITNETGPKYPGPSVR